MQSQSSVPSVRGPLPKRDHRAQHTVICEQCGLSFRPNRCSDGRYCSSACYGLSKQKPPTHGTCEQCGIAFSRKGRGALRFCSRTCTYLASRKYPDRFCETCGVLLERQRNGAHPRFCSKRCLASRRRVYAVRVRVQYGARFAILKRDNYRCRICGATADDGVKLHVDHKVPVSKGGTGDPSNLWTLCQPCNHGKHTKSL